LTTAEHWNKIRILQEIEEYKSERKEILLRIFWLKNTLRKGFEET